jgi:DNA-binding NtrC family response regulator
MTGARGGWADPSWRARFPSGGQEERPGRGAVTSHRHVLIVDDNLSLAENIAEILQFDGHTTRLAGSAEEAFPKGFENQPDVVVTDYRLPGINGAAFVKQFLVMHTHARAMVISAYTDDTTIAAATNAGATFMAKPLDLKLLGRWVCEGSA